MNKLTVECALSQLHPRDCIQYIYVRVYLVPLFPSLSMYVLNMAPTVIPPYPPLSAISPTAYSSPLCKPKWASNIYLEPHALIVQCGTTILIPVIVLMNTHLTLLPNVSMLWVACARGVRGIGGKTARQCPVTRGSFDSNKAVELSQNHTSTSRIIILPAPGPTVQV